MYHTLYIDYWFEQIGPKLIVQRHILSDDIFNCFSTIYDTARAFPTAASHCHALQIHVLVCESSIWPVQIDPNDMYYRCRFYFRFFTYHPLQVLLFDHGWDHSLVAFRPHYWYILGLFCPLKLMALTYPSVVDSIFSISPFWPPAGPNTQQRLMVFISAL